MLFDDADSLLIEPLGIETRYQGYRCKSIVLLIEPLGIETRTTPNITQIMRTFN